jgi:hypothetical protein
MGIEEKIFSWLKTVAIGIIGFILFLLFGTVLSKRDGGKEKAGKSFEIIEEQINEGKKSTEIIGGGINGAKKIIKDKQEEKESMVSSSSAGREKAAEEAGFRKA